MNDHKIIIKNKIGKEKYIIFKEIFKLIITFYIRIYISKLDY